MDASENRPLMVDVTTSVRRGVLLILSSPSGAGKSTLSRNLLQTEQNITMSVSVTTRTRRSSEIEGVHYFFRTVPEFHALREHGELLEWAEIHGNFYGTPRKPVEEALTHGRDILFDIDVQGTRAITDAMRADSASVFILPPSIAEMRSRLRRRAEDDDAAILRRLRTAEGELQHWQDYDYVLVNDDLDRTFAALQAILAAERLRRFRRPALGRLVDLLDRDLKELFQAH